MSTVRWKYLAETNRLFRFGSWLFTQLGTMPLPGPSYHCLALEFDHLETIPSSR